MSPENRSTALTRRKTLILAAASLAACQRAPSTPAASAGQSLQDKAGRRFYSLRNGRAAWTRDSSATLMRIIGGAAAHGLAAGAFTPKIPAGGGQDEALTLAALAYAKALASGFIDPRSIESIFTLERNAPDVAAGLAQALDADRLEEWFGSLAPADATYRALSQAYRTAISQAGVPAAPVRGGPVGASMAPAEQARQLAANLERRRWLARTPPTHRIDVNTAGAFLGYFRQGQPAASARTVVGSAKHPTPSLQASFHKLVANPPWRVPDGIAAAEILPKGPGYMARENMHMEGGRVVQAPGPKSALGLVKFDVEDPYDIYLHDTPAKALFAADERHRSHGCIRVENAVAFARSLASETGKDAEFDQALAGGETQEVDLGQTIAVRLLYHTAYLDEAGQVRLAEDVYGTDDKLATALGQRQVAAARHGRVLEDLPGP